MKPFSIYEEIKIIFISTMAALMGDILFSKLLTILILGEPPSTNWVFSLGSSTFQLHKF